MEEYKNIVFDLGNVLIDIDQAKTRNALKSLFQKSGEDFQEVEKEIRRIARKFELGNISSPVFVNSLLRLFDSHEIQAVDVIRAWNATLLSIPPHSISILCTLQKTHRTYILSNTNALHMDWARQYLQEHYDISDLEELVIKAYFSHDLLARKPDAECFEKLIAGSGLKPEETLFVDDTPANLSAAKALGFSVAHTPNTRACREFFGGYLEEE